MTCNGTKSARRGTLAALAAFTLVTAAERLLAAEGPVPPGLVVRRLEGAVAIDGDLSDPGWKALSPITTWYEVNPGDNTEPPVKNVAYLGYDDRFFYAAFEFQDPQPNKIRAPLGDRDNVPPSNDYGGVILDTRNDGKTGVLFLANPRGIQYDAVTDDTGNGEDSSPDFFWDSAAKITPEGWNLEIRIPFSSLRYASADPQTWGIMLYRNYPRAFRYQIFSTQLPRGGSCFICRANRLQGLEHLPAGGHVVVAPYVSGSERAIPRDDPGTPLRSEGIDVTGGFDVKWTPGANTALDGTIHPDFSQVESDVPQIATNERFALFFPEKRPFFLEGVELFGTPVQAVYTRTITSPRWGVRGTGKRGALAYTALMAEDEGGGSVVLPGANSSDLADQDFRSYVGVARVRRDFGRSFAGALFTTREVHGGGHNRVAGPDFQWRPSASDTVAGQLLWSDTLTPTRPDLTALWDGSRLHGHAGATWWSHSTATLDWFAQYRDVGTGFRADDGFVPQVGYRKTYGETGYTFRPTGLLRRLRTFLIAERSTDTSGDLLGRQVSFGTGMDGRWGSFVRLRYAFDRVRSGERTLPRQQFLYIVQASPSRIVSQVSLDGFVGEEVDFDNDRVGRGGNASLEATVRPSDHLELRFSNGRRWLDVDAPRGGRARLFTARVDRVRATYTVNARCFLRLIGQYVGTRRDPSLYRTEVEAKDGAFSASGLFAYKVNWQTVLFLGYGDNRSLVEDTNRLVRDDRQFFLKLSYAWQR